MIYIEGITENAIIYFLDCIAINMMTEPYVKTKNKLNNKDNLQEIVYFNHPYQLINVFSTLLLNVRILIK